MKTLCKLYYDMYNGSESECVGGILTTISLAGFIGTIGAVNYQQYGFFIGVFGVFIIAGVAYHTGKVISKDK